MEKKVLGMFVVVIVLIAVSFVGGVKYAGYLTPADGGRADGDALQETGIKEASVAPQAEKERQVRVYFYNSEKDQEQCTQAGLAPVERTVKDHADIKDTIRDTITLLLEGKMSAEEKAQGISSEYPLEGLRLTDLALDGEGVLTLSLEDPESKTSGGSCRSAVLYYQLEYTAKQFAEVKEIRVKPEDSMFQP